MYRFDHAFGALAMGIADEYLPKGFLINQADDLGHPCFVEFVKNIIQK